MGAWEQWAMDRSIEAHAALTVLEERIRTLWGYRVWFRRYRWADHPLHRQELNVELRALVRLLREARRVAREAQRAPEPVATLALGDHFQGMGHLPSSKATRGSGVVLAGRVYEGMEDY